MEIVCGALQGNTTTTANLISVGHFALNAKDQITNGFLNASVDRVWTASHLLDLFEFQEREDHTRRGREERQHRESSGQEHRRARNSDRDRHRGHSHQRRSSNERPGSGQAQGRDRDVQNLQAQDIEREFYNARRRENRQKNEVSASGNESQGSVPRPGGNNKDKEPPAKEKPSFELSGALLEDTNTFRGVVIKYSEPPEARIPKKRWRLYPFKNDEVLPVMYIHRQSAYLLGRHRRIADIPIDHPSCSKQHAVFQYRWVHVCRKNQRRGQKPRVSGLLTFVYTCVQKNPMFRWSNLCIKFMNLTALCIITYMCLKASHLVSEIQILNPATATSQGFGLRQATLCTCFSLPQRAIWGVKWKCTWEWLACVSAKLYLTICVDICYCLIITALLRGG